MIKILLLRFSSLGDVVLTTPVYKNLKRRLPGCEITVATKEKYASVLAGNPDIDHLLLLAKGESLRSFLQRVRRGRFDVLIDLHNNLRSNLLSLFSGIPKKIRYRKAVWARRLFVKKRRPSEELKRHTIHRYLETLRPLGIDPEICPPEIFPGAVQARAALNILVIQTAFLGDAVLTTPLFEALKASLPASRIAVLCTPEIEAIFSGHPAVAETLVMDKRGKEGGVGSLLGWAGKLKGRFDVALLPHRSFRSALLAWLARIPKRIGFENSQGRFLLTDAVPFDWGRHDTERNLSLLTALGIENPSAPVRVDSSGVSLDWNAFRERHRLQEGQTLVGMNPGSVWRTKRWLPERFAGLADKLIREHRCAVLLFGGNGDREAVAAVTAQMKEKPVDLCGRTDLAGLAYLIGRCSLFVTNDSGPMHLAWSQSVPTVAVFGPTTRELGFFPLGEKSRVVEVDLECRPCTLHGGELCPLDHFRCMREVTVEMVYERCLDLLGSPRP